MLVLFWGGPSDEWSSTFEGKPRRVQDEMQFTALVGTIELAKWESLHS